MRDDGAAIPPEREADHLPKADPASGLDEDAARGRLNQYGRNAVEEPMAPLWQKFTGKLWGPVPWMLEAVIVLQVVLGRRASAAVIAALLVFNAVIALLQERKAGNALALLKQHLRVRARVLRSGIWGERPAEDIVPGDIIHIRAGDIVPADLTLIVGTVSLDQSALTGEALPIEAGPSKPAYAGSIVRQGEATGEVTGTGARTFFGRTTSLVARSAAPSHMQKTIFAIVQRLMIFDLAMVALVLLYAYLHGLPPADTLLFALMLLVASVPVALPATYTLATATSSAELARNGVLVTRLPAVEEAAAMDSLVSDKTGTLTQNSLTFAGAIPLATGTDEAHVLRMAALASDESTQDPLDLALLRAAREGGLLSDIPQCIAVIPFDPATRRSEARYQTANSELVVMKGAASTLLDLVKPPPEERQAVMTAVEQLSGGGARVLAVATRTEGALRIEGVVSLSDLLRADAAKVISDLKSFGVRVRMATGDALGTARAVGRALGIGERVCSPATDLGRLDSCDLFARVLPEDKHAIVSTLQAQGHVVGMTGDGVNDAPALRQAELGIAVTSATDVAKAAAGVVLTEPGLGGVVTVIRAGREVHRRMLTYVLNKVLKTIVIVSLLTAGVWLTGGFVISSTLVVLLLFTNDFMTMSIASDNVEPPKSPGRWDIGSLTRTSLLLAVPTVALALGLFWWIRSTQELSPVQLETVTFLLLVSFGQASLYALRTDGAMWSLRPGRWMLAASAADAAVVIALAHGGWLMAAVPWHIIAIVILAGLVLAVMLDAVKRGVAD